MHLMFGISAYLGVEMHMNRVLILLLLPFLPPSLRSPRDYHLQRSVDENLSALPIWYSLRRVLAPGL